MTLFQKRFQNVRNHFVLELKHEKNGTFPVGSERQKLLWNCSNSKGVFAPPQSTNQAIQACSNRQCR